MASAARLETQGQKASRDRMASVVIKVHGVGRATLVLSEILVQRDLGDRRASWDRRVHKGSVVMSVCKANEVLLDLRVSAASVGILDLLESAEMRVRSALLVPRVYLGSGARLGRPAHQESAENQDFLVSAVNAASAEILGK
jgi:hypothetical protein